MHLTYDLATIKSQCKMQFYLRRRKTNVRWIECDHCSLGPQQNMWTWTDIRQMARFFTTTLQRTGLIWIWWNKFQTQVQQAFIIIQQTTVVTNTLEMGVSDSMPDAFIYISSFVMITNTFFKRLLRLWRLIIRQSGGNPARNTLEFPAHSFIF